MVELYRTLGHEVRIEPLDDADLEDYCAGCAYSVKVKRGKGACPFNPLYWDFMHRNRDRLAGNPRMAQMYRTWDRMKDDTKRETLDSAAEILRRLDAGERV